MNKLNVVYPYNGILLGNRRNRVTDAHYNMDEPWRHQATWKKPVAKDSDYMKCPAKANV